MDVYREVLGLLEKRKLKRDRIRKMSKQVCRNVSIDWLNWMTGSPEEHTRVIERNSWLKGKHSKEIQQKANRQ